MYLSRKTNSLLKQTLYMRILTTVLKYSYSCTTTCQRSHLSLCILGVTVCATYPFSNGNFVQSDWTANQV